ncbi:beta-ketoacyl-[acyl-carrier-protein] synthase family protein [[Kitasatospora] papulosa]|uniref:beta-ketoacyl-[acyl-carrier-protein] synthase family protein n=1 Tax=[Kitasatospora] papulosa TaxID=1464011 RepID=UPI0036BD38EB
MSIVITGIGARMAGSPSTSAFWENLRAGRPGVRSLTGDPRFTDIDNAMAATVTCRRPSEALPGLDHRHARSCTDEALVAMAVMDQARRDASLTDDAVDPGRLDVVASSSRGPLAWWTDHIRDRQGADPPAVPRTAALTGLPGAPATLYAIYGNVRGQVTTLSSACVGGHQALGWAVERLRTEAADAVIVAGHEFPVVPELFTCYNTLGVLSRRVDDPPTACRPYSRDRDGFVLGEGAVALLLERSQSAHRRGARVYAEVLGQRSGNEARHATGMDPTGRSAADLVCALMDDTRRRVGDVSYVAGHASGTSLNDLSECRMMRRLYAGTPPAAWPPLGGNKAVFGHTLGASGLVNAAACALMIHHQELARTRLPGPVDPECDLDHVAEGPRRGEVGLTLSLSFALGSQTSALLLAAPS